MDKISIIGGNILSGSIEISGAKNAALPIMASCLLTDETVILSNVPHLGDIVTMINLLLQHGVNIDIDGNYSENSSNRIILLSANDIISKTAPYDIVRKMRASIWVLGPLLARFGEASVSLPGGCAIGARPVDMHLSALESMGAIISLSDGYINASVIGRLKGAEIHFDKISVGATINILMAATLAIGTTIIHNAAREPEIIDLIKCLKSMGACISGAGTSTLTVTGKDKLHGANHKIIADRLEAGTYAIAASITGGDIELLNIEHDIIDNITEKLIATGTKIELLDHSIRVINREKIIKPIDITTNPYPGFPTDMQAQFMALMSVASGSSIISENIFENRFMHAAELIRMGANITLSGNNAIIRGVDRLNAAEVMATDLRASVSLVLAGLIAEGETIINRVYHLDRGYERIEEKLASCGASIRRIK